MGKSLFVAALVGLSAGMVISLIGERFRYSRIGKLRISLLGIYLFASLVAIGMVAFNLIASWWLPDFAMPWTQVVAYAAFTGGLNGLVFQKDI